MASDSLPSVSRVEVVRLPDLLEGILRGELQFAAFHRPLVWPQEMQLALLESIFRGLPVGVVTTWRTRRTDIRPSERFGSFHIPSAEPWHRNYILDGQQRLATLLHALFRVELLASTAEDGDFEPADFYYDLQRELFHYSSKLKVDGGPHLPLRDILAVSRFIRFQRDLYQGHWHGSSSEVETLIERSDRVARAFRDYQVPVVALATDDLAFVAQSFENLNARGSPMGTLHMVNAMTELTYGWGLIARMDALIEEHLTDIGTRETIQETLLRICKVQAGLPPMESRDELLVRALAEDAAARLERATHALRRAAQFFSEEMAIPAIDLVPYAYQVTLVAGLLLERAEVDRTCCRRLSQWVWLTTYSEAFAGLTSAGWYRLYEEAQAVSSGRPLESEAGSSRIRKPLGRFDYRRARSRALALLLAGNDPVDPFPAPSRGMNTRLAALGAEALPRLVDANMMSGDLSYSSGARVLLSAPSVKMLREVLREPSRYPGDFERLLDSHFITHDGQQAFAGEHYGTFIHLREETLNKIEQQRFDEIVHELSQGSSAG